MKLLPIFLVIIFAWTAQAAEGMNIMILKENSIKEIQKANPKVSASELVFIGMDVNTKSKELAKSYIELDFVDKNSLHSDDFSEFSYDRYIVSFNIISGVPEKVEKGGWGSYQSVDNHVIK